jgi:hypothetical protein
MKCKNMKRILILLFCVSAISFMVTSCGETYEEATGNNFQGTWVYIKNELTDTTNREVPVFLQIRELDGEKVMLFYTQGRYDSSFVYREEESSISGASNIYVRRIWDYDSVLRAYKVYDRDLEEYVTKYKKVWEARKPETIDSTFREKYFGTNSFDLSESSPLMHIKRYKTNEQDKPESNGVPLRDDVYKRPSE